jgi:hypothetical protein
MATSSERLFVDPMNDEEDIRCDTIHLGTKSLHFVNMFDFALCVFTLVVVLALTMQCCFS